MIERFNTFTVLIAKINRSIRRIKSEAMVEYNLKSPHVSCIYYLYPDKQLTIGELCEICDEDKGAISRSVKYLVKNGYIDYSGQENKKYRKKLLLTQKGKDVGNFISEHLSRILLQTGNDIGDDMQVFYRCLEKVSDSLENMADNSIISGMEEKE